jgi:hypothetical protein
MANRRITMAAKRIAAAAILLSSVSIWCMAAAVDSQSPASATGNTASSGQARTVAVDDRLSIAVARERAKWTHDIYAATLEMLHHRYFHGDRAAVPARAMQDVFSEIKRQSNVEARWISVNMKAMSIDHEPKSEFEKLAAREIAAGKADFEVVEDGYLRRAGAIPLTGGCIGCHGGFSKEQSKGPKFAGLVISVPVTQQMTKTQ